MSETPNTFNPKQFMRNIERNPDFNDFLKMCLRTISDLRDLNPESRKKILCDLFSFVCALKDIPDTDENKLEFFQKYWKSIQGAILDEQNHTNEGRILIDYVLEKLEKSDIKPDERVVAMRKHFAKLLDKQAKPAGWLGRMISCEKTLSFLSLNNTTMRVFLASLITAVAFQWAKLDTLSQTPRFFNVKIDPSRMVNEDYRKKVNEITEERAEAQQFATHWTNVGMDALTMVGTLGMAAAMVWNDAVKKSQAENNTQGGQSDTPPTTEPERGQSDTPPTTEPEGGQSDTPPTPEPEGGRSNTPQTTESQGGRSDTPRTRESPVMPTVRIQPGEINPINQGNVIDVSHREVP